MKTLILSNLSPISEYEMDQIIGGWDGLDFKIAEYLGYAVGISTKLLWNGFKIYSSNLNYLQEKTMLIHK